jgi:hypothetical protein
MRTASRVMLVLPAAKSASVAPRLRLSSGESAPPITGALLGWLDTATGVPQLLHGSGSPEGLVFASQGSLLMRRDNSGSGNALYAKSTGVTLSTGWQPFQGSVAPTTTLPANPADGQQAVLVDSTSSPTYGWLLQYSATAAKWIFLGGSPLYAEVLTSQNTASTSYTDLTTVGPSVTIPRAGTYEITSSALLSNSQAGQQSWASPKLGSATASDNDAIMESGPVGATSYDSRTIVRSGLNASDVIKLQYRSNTGTNTATFQYRNLQVRPVLLT